MFSHVTRVSVCRRQMAACRQSSRSERYNAPTLLDRNMGESLSGDRTKVRAVPVGRDAPSIPCRKRESGLVGLWFVTVPVFCGDL